MIGMLRIFLLLALLAAVDGWVVLPTSQRSMTNRANSQQRQTTTLRAIEDDQRAASKEVMKGTVVGGVIGGVLGGPFGALFGSQIGNRFGVGNSEKEANRRKLERLGISEDMVLQAETAGKEAFEAQEALQMVRDATSSSRELAVKLESEIEFLYGRASECLKGGDDDEAKKYLLKRTRAQDKQKKALLDVIENRGREERIAENILEMENRVTELQKLISRAIGAKSVVDANRILEEL